MFMHIVLLGYVDGSRLGGGGCLSGIKCQSLYLMSLAWRSNALGLGKARENEQLKGAMDDLYHQIWITFDSK